ncbi:monocarboxylate permease [Flammula alnicola]|nr:monocarboxylate permease [Flammula alnicola]
MNEKTDEKTEDVTFREVSSKEQDSEGLQPTPTITFPEGGWRAWCTIAGAYINSFGVYQDFYVRNYLRNFSTSTIGWIGGVQICLNFAPGIITGRLFDRGYFIVLYAVALFMLSLSHEESYYQVFLTNGVCLGLASGLTYSSSLSIPGHYFRRRRSFAVGIVSSGAAMGSVIQPIMLNKLINGPIGFHTAVRISASLNVFLLIVAACLMRTRLPPKEKTQSFPVMQWLRTEPAYLALVLTGIPCFIGLFFAPFYIQLNATSHGVERNLSFYAVSILNAGSFFGRILPGLFSNRFGVFNLGTFFTLGTGVVVLSMIAVKNFVGTVVFAICFGLFSGACIALTPAMFGVLPHMAHNPNEIGTRLGMYLGLGGFIGLFATPILGALLTSQYHWVRPILLSGISMLIGGCLYGISRHYSVKKHGTHRI